jgi:hypothetical protein
MGKLIVNYEELPETHILTYVECSNVSVENAFILLHLSMNDCSGVSGKTYYHYYTVLLLANKPRRSTTSSK